MSASVTRRGLVVLALLAALVASQFAALATAPAGFQAQTGRIAADTGAAYLTGLRRFVAAVLWNRIDPLMHGYYAGVSLDHLLFMVPTLTAVVWLDPHLEDASYVLPYLLARNGRARDAIRVAAQAVADNPHSGKLLISDAQIAELYGHDLARAVKLVGSALGPQTTWRDDVERWDSLAIGRGILVKAGRAKEAARVTKILDAITAAHPEGLVAPE